MQLLEHAHDELRVAVDVGADLQDRDAAVSSGEQHQVRLRHHVRLLDGAPREALVREHLAYLLGERRRVVLMQEQLGQWHAGSLLDSSGSDAYKTAASPSRPRPFNLTR